MVSIQAERPAQGLDIRPGRRRTALGCAREVGEERCQPLTPLAAWRGVRFASAGTVVSIHASQCFWASSSSSASSSGVRSGAGDRDVAVSWRSARRA